MNGPAHEEAIRERAYHIWETHGRISGKDLDHWLQAEREMTKLKTEPAAKATAVGVAMEAAPAESKPAAKRKKSTATPAKSRSKKKS